MKAVIESIGRVGSRARVGEHELVFDQPRSVPGGEDRGPSPLDGMVVSVAACAHYFARRWASRVAVLAFMGAMIAHTCLWCQRGGRGVTDWWEKQ